MRTWPDATLDALWLTAQRWDDPSLDAVARALPQDVCDRIRARHAQHAQQGRAAKARRLTAIVQSLRPPTPPDARLPPRALALVATEVPRGTGRRWIANSPAPRRGFHADRALRTWLGRLARAPEAP